MARGIDTAHKGHRFLGYFTEVIDKVINLLLDHFHQGFDVHVEHDFVANHMGAHLIVLVGASFLGYGASLNVGIGIPIPLLSLNIARRVAVRDEEGSRLEAAA